MSGGAGPLVPTFHGFVHNSMDGLVLFEACLSGKLHHVPRRPHDRERSSLIKSGSIFIYEENASGIKRWTDGVAWSPSRILGNFLLYRELEKPFPPGEKKRAMKRKRQSIPGEPYPRRDSDDAEAPELPTPMTPPAPNVSGEGKPEVPSTDQDKELERSLIGSLVDSYGFRPDGLVKKTMSISVNGISHHMVSYYKVDDVKNHILPRPLSDHRLQGISVRPELYMKQNFRAPVEETDQYALDGHLHPHPHMLYSPMNGTYGVPQHGQYFRGQPYPGMYNMPPPHTTSSGMYTGMTGTSWPGQQASAGPSQYSHQPYGGQSYYNPYRPSDQSNGSAVKTESQQASSQSTPYPNQYASAYGGMPQRSGSQSTPSMMQPPYQTPQAQAPSTFPQMTSGGQRTSYSGIDSPSANSQQQQAVYGNNSSAQSYAVRSPGTQGYGISSAPQSAVTQSPHPGAKSPQSSHAGTPSQSDPSAQLQNTGMSYRTSHPSSEMSSGLGISTNTSSYSAPQNGHSYNYGSSTQSQTAVPYPSS